VQAGIPGHTEKGKQDKGDGKKQQGTTKDEKQGDTANTRGGNGHKTIIQPEGCQLQFKNIVCVCAIVILTVCVWQMDGHYKTEVEHLQKKVIMMEQKIQGLTVTVNNAATKQDIGDVSSRITQLDTKIETKCKGQ
jgi:hypothetical protein